jgi:hypothetical protein
MKHSIRTTVTVASALAAVSGLALVGPASAATVKAGQKCTKVGEVKNGLVCKQVGNKRTYQKQAAAPTTAAAVVGAATPAPAAGIAAARGFDGKTIKVGYLGNVATSPAGFNAYISRINEAGGIGGKYQVDVLFKEAYYDAAESVKKYTELKDDVVMIGQVYGTPGTQAIRDSLKRDNMVASPISLDAEWVTSDSYLPIGTTYQAHAINLADWYLKEGGGAGKTLCSLSIAPNPYGIALEEGYDFAAKKLGFKNGGRFRFTTADATAQQLKDAKCDGVVTAISGELHTSPLLSAGEKISYFPTYLSSSPTFASRRVTSANSKLYNDQVIVAIDGAQWGDSAIPGMKDFLADMGKFAPQYIGAPNPAAIWGYVQARTVVAALNNAVKLGDLSPDGIKKAIASLGKVTYDGLYPDWNYTTPAQRVAPSQIHVARADVSVKGALQDIKVYDSAAAKEYRR